MRCLVTGASGFIGSHLVDSLVGRGAEVICLVRETSDLRWIRETGAEIRVADLKDSRDVARHLPGVGTVFHCAGAIAAGSASAFRRANWDLTRSVLDACAATSPSPRLVYVSSLAAAGPSSSVGPLVEGQPPMPISAYGRSKLAGERAVGAYADRVPATIVRPPVVYGPRDKGLLSAFRIVSRRLRPLLGCHRRLSLIYVRDLVEGLVRAGVTERAIGRTYYLTHPRPLSMCELASGIARALRVRTVPVPAPDPIVLAAGSLAEITGQITGRPGPFNLAKAREMTASGWVCDGARARSDLNFEPCYPHEQALRETARWYRKHGWI